MYIVHKKNELDCQFLLNFLKINCKLILYMNEQVEHLESK